MSPDSSFPNSEPARRVTKYRLLDYLGHGSYGEVHRAQDVHTKRFVAMKLLWGATDAAQFVREIECHARLHHSNIVQIYDAGEWHDGRFYIALQFIEGSPLHAKIEDEQLRDPVAAVKLVSKIARAIFYAHQHSVLHCDLKPGNILIDQNGVPFVSDFSIGHLLDRARAHDVSGTLPYSAPELCKPSASDRHEAERCTDVYALGAILYHLITGKTPYPPHLSRNERAEAFARNDMPLAPSLLDRSAQRAIGRKPDRDLDEICATALAIEPYQRYPSADALADDLDRWALGVPICGPNRKTPATGEHAWRSIRRNPLALLGLMLVLACLLAGVVVNYLAVEQIHAWFLAANRTSAQLQGQILASRFEMYRREISDLAQQPHIKHMFQHPAKEQPPDVAETVGQRLSAVNWRGGPDQFYFLDRSGCFVSYWPSSAVSPDVYASWYGFRDYFLCAQTLADKHSRNACLGRVFRSEYDWVPNTLRMAVAAPVYDDDGAWIGVLAASWPIERSLSELAATSPAALHANASLLVARDRERSQLKTAGTALPACGPARSDMAGPALPNPSVEPAPRDELVILPRSAPRHEQQLSAADSEHIAKTLAGGAYNAEAFIDQRNGKRYVAGVAALNQHPATERLVDLAPLLVEAVDPDAMSEYTSWLHTIAFLLFSGSFVVLYVLFVTLLRSDREKLRWLKGLH